MLFEETIAAISTPPGQGGIGIVRISGPKSLGIAREIFVFPGDRVYPFRDRYLHYGKVRDNENRIIDEVLLTYMKAPRSYTAEDVVEIHCHGGIISVKRILEEVIKNGARPAQPGEFTKRAFLNGRIDLAQAEAVMDLISAKTERSARVSVDQMGGGLSGRIRDIRERLLNMMAHVEVTIDYPEEDIDEPMISRMREETTEISKEIEGLLKTAEEGKIIRQGIKAVIVGRTNVGKSSLLNALLRENRAIVTDIPGTTRDVIEDYINIRGIAVRIVDTAGIRETPDQIEMMGIERSKKNMDDADLVIMVLDSSAPLGYDDRQIMEYLRDKKSLVLLNKMDKEPLLTREDVAVELGGDIPIVNTSMTLGTGIDKVEDMIYKMFFEGEIESGHDVTVTNVRHQDALIRAHNHLADIIEGLDTQIPLDIVSIDLRGALDSLGSITGETVADDLIHRIFSEFCLGK